MTIDIEKLALDSGALVKIKNEEYVLLVEGEMVFDNKSLKQFAEAYAAKVLEDKEREIDRMHEKISENVFKILKLQAHINDLREALNAMRDAFDVGGTVTSAENNALHKADQSLLKTPAQSLQEHDNQLIEKCAEIVWFYEWIGKEASEAIVSKIRALKG